MKIVAIAQQKGGVGKTTSVVNLGAVFADWGCRVLAVDCDPQGSLTLALGIDPVEVPTTIGDAMLLDTAVPVVRTQVAGLDLCPANRILADVEFQLAPRVGRERYLARALNRLDRRRYDLVLLDTPPSLGLLTINCLAAAEVIFVPVTPSILGAAGLRDLLATVDEVREGINPRLRVGGVFVSFADTRTIAGRRSEAELREDLGPLMLNTTVSRRIAHEYGAQAGYPVVIMEPGSPAAAEFRALAEEVRDRVDIQAPPAADHHAAVRAEAAA